MKNLLYKEFAESKGMLKVGLAISVLALLVSLKLHSTSILGSLLCVLAFSMIARNMGDDEKSGWEKYSRALPNNAFQRMGAKYVFSVLIMLSTSAVVFLATVLGNIKGITSGETEFVLNAFKKTATAEIFRLSLIFISLSLVFPISCIFKGQVRSLLIAVPIAPTFFITYLITSWLIPSSEIDLVFNSVESISKPKHLLMLAATAILFLAATYLICVVLETKSGREKLKAVKGVAAVLTVAALAVSGTTVYALYKDGAFEWREFSYSDEYEESIREKEEEWEKQNELARADMMKYIEEFCGETLVDKKTEYVKERITQIGFGERITEIDLLYATDYPLAIAIYAYGNSERPEYPDKVNVWANVAATEIITDSNPVELAEQIAGMFTEGLSEEKMIEYMKMNNLCPDTVYENLDGSKPYKTYYIDFIIEENIPVYNVRAAVNLSIDVMDGEIWTTRVYVEEDDLNPQTKP